MAKNKLQLQQLNDKMLLLNDMKRAMIPMEGWINAVRTSIGMSLEQLATRMHKTRQSMREMEQREKDGNITLKTLSEAAKAMDMQLVYGFVAKDGSLEALIDRKAKELARSIVGRTSVSMKLEDQENSASRIQQAINERAEELKKEIPKILWD